jgi:hypothetical protein
MRKTAAVSDPGHGRLPSRRRLYKRLVEKRNPEGVLILVFGASATDGRTSFASTLTT